MATLRYWLWFTICALSMVVKSQDGFDWDDYYQNNPPVGIHLGTDSITAIIPNPKGDPHLLSQEGNLPYKAFMRQSLWDPRTNTQTPQPLNITSTNILSKMYGPPATPAQLNETFSQLHSAISPFLNDSIPSHIGTSAVVSVPFPFGDRLRQAVKDGLHAAGINTLRSSSRPALTVFEQGWNTDEEKGYEHMFFWVEASAAALDMAIIAVDYGIVEILAYTARPDLGEDALALEVARQLADDGEALCREVDAQAVLGTKDQIHARQQSPINDNAADTDPFSISSLLGKARSSANTETLHDIEARHHANIFHCLEAFLNTEHIDHDSPSYLRPWHIDIQTLTEIVLVGDASAPGTLAVKRAIAHSEMLRNLTVLGNLDIAPGEAAARGAAKLGAGFRDERWDMYCGCYV